MIKSYVQCSTKSGLSSGERCLTLKVRASLKASVFVTPSLLDWFFFSIVKGKYSNQFHSLCHPLC